MSTLPPPPAIEASPVQRVIFLNRLEMNEEGMSFAEPSFPGHHIQLSESGVLQVETCGRCFEVGPGGLMWLHNDEEFRYRVVQAPRRFYVLSFHAPTLPPPPYEARCLSLSRDRIVPRFQTLLDTWRNRDVPPLLRTFRVHAALGQILSDVMTHIARTVPINQEVALWWRVETEIRQNLHRPIGVREMARWVNRSPATITRACERAVRIPPRERVRLIRMNMARGLIWMTSMSISQVADRVGYSRVQELSREYHKTWRITPLEDRARFPAIYERVFGMPYTTERG